MALVRAAKALALSEGRSYCVPDDVKELAAPAFAHRVLLRSRWDDPVGETPDAEQVIRQILQDVPVPR